jgi:hypothetical protein
MNILLFLLINPTHECSSIKTKDSFEVILHVFCLTDFIEKLSQKNCRRQEMIYYSLEGRPEIRV